MDGKKIVIAGGSGRLGQVMSRILLDSGYSITVLTRNAGSAQSVLPQGVRAVQWDPYEPGKWSEELESAKCVVNLSGADIFAKWNQQYKKEIVESRVRPTANLVKAFEGLDTKPETFINASAAGIYGYDEISSDEHTEESPAADDFFGRLVSDWESEALKAQDMGIRTSMVRTAVVLSMKGGALPELYRLFKRHMGSYIKPGNQWIPWIHILDEVSVFRFIMENSSVSGPVNACTDSPVTMKDFSAAIGKAMNRGMHFGVPQFMIRAIMGEVSMLVTTGKKVIPAVLNKNGFEFQFPDLDRALADLIRKNSY